MKLSKILISSLFFLTPLSAQADYIYQDSEGAINVKMPDFPLVIYNDGRANFMGQVIDCNSSSEKSRMNDGAVFTCSSGKFSLAAPSGAFDYTAKSGSASLVLNNGRMEQRTFKVKGSKHSVSIEDADEGEDLEDNDYDSVEVNSGGIKVKSGKGEENEVIIENPGRVAEEGYKILGKGVGGIVVGASGDQKAGDDAAEGLAVAGKILGGLANGVTGSHSGKINVRSADGDSVEIGDGSIHVNSKNAKWRITSDKESYNTDTVMQELKVTKKGSEININMADSVLFDFNSADLKPTATQTLEKVAFLIKKKSVGQVNLEGHTDSIGGEESNIELSKRRVSSVMTWLIKHEGIPSEVLAGKGFGESRPIAHNTLPDGSDDPEGRAKNRRVTFKFDAN